MAEVFNTEVIFRTTDNITKMLGDIVKGLRAADTAAKDFQTTLNELKVGKLTMPGRSVFSDSGRDAGRAFAAGFAEGTGQSIRSAIDRANRDVSAAMRDAAVRARRDAERNNAPITSGALVPVGPRYSQAVGGAMGPFLGNSNAATPGPVLLPPGPGSTVGRYGLPYAGNASTGLMGTGNAGSLGAAGGMGMAGGAGTGAGGGSGGGGGSGLVNGGSGMGSAFWRGAAGLAGRTSPPIQPPGPPPPPGSPGPDNDDERDPWAALAAGHVLGRAGHAITGHVTSLIHDGMKYGAQVANLGLSGFNQDELRSGIAAAWRVSGTTATSNVTDNVRVLGELRYALGSAEHAEGALESVQRMSAILGAVTHGRITGDQTYQAARALEMANRGNTTEQLNANMDLLTRSIVATQGKVNPREYLGFIQQLGSNYAAGMGDNFRYGTSFRLIQEMGGQRAGTAMASILDQLMSGRMPKEFRERLVNQFHLGHMVGSGKNAHYVANDSELLGKDLYEYLQKYVAPMLVGKTEAQQNEIIGQIFSNRNSRREASIMLRQGRVLMPGRDAHGTPNSPIERDNEIIHGIGPNLYGRLLNSNPEVQMAAFTAQWGNFTTALGNTVLPVVVPALRSMTSTLIDFTKWLRTQNPEDIRKYVIAIASVGIALTTMGTLAIGLGAVILLFTTLTGPVAAAVIAIGILVGAMFGIGTSLLTTEGRARVANRAVELYNSAIAGFHRFMEGGRAQWAQWKVDIAAVWKQWNDDYALVRGTVWALTAAFHGLRSAMEWLINLLPGTHGAPPPIPPSGTEVVPGFNPDVPGAMPGINMPAEHGAYTPSTGAGQRSSYAPVGTARPVIVHARLELDGRVAARSVLRQLERELNQPSSGSNRFDPSMAPYQPGSVRV